MPAGSPPTQTPPPKPKPRHHHHLLLLTAPSLLALALAVFLTSSTNPLPSLLHLILRRKPSLLRPPEPGPVSDTSADAGRPPCVLWMAPFASGGGYCSEAWSYVASLDGNVAAGVGANFTLSIAHRGDLESSEFWHGLPEQSKNLAYRLATSRCQLSRAVVVCHSEPGAWYPPMYESLPCPPTGYDEPAFVIGRTMFETDCVSPEHVRRCNQMDAVWVPTDFHVSTFVNSGVDRSRSSRWCRLSMSRSSIRPSTMPFLFQLVGLSWRLMIQHGTLLAPKAKALCFLVYSNGSRGRAGMCC